MIRWLTDETFFICSVTNWEFVATFQVIPYLDPKEVRSKNTPAISTCCHTAATRDNTTEILEIGNVTGARSQIGSVLIASRWLAKVNRRRRYQLHPLNESRVAAMFDEWGSGLYC